MWRFTSNKNDMYAGGPAMGDQKLSLHASGQCRWAHTAAPADGSDRAFIKWVRPAAVEQPRHVFLLVFPEKYLCSPKPLERETDLTLRMPMPPSGGATILVVGFSTVAPYSVRIPSEMARDYMAMRLANGEWIYLVPQATQAFDDSQIVFPMTLTPNSQPDTGQDPQTVKSAYLHLFSGPNEEGVASVVEINNLTITSFPKSGLVKAEPEH